MVPQAFLLLEVEPVQGNVDVELVRHRKLFHGHGRLDALGERVADAPRIRQRDCDRVLEFRRLLLNVVARLEKKRAAGVVAGKGPRAFPF